MERSIDNLEMRRLMQQYGDSLLRICFVYLKDIQLAEDAVQDTFLKVYRSSGEFRGESHEKTWITRIAINTCKSYLRTCWLRKVSVEDALESVPVSDPDSTDDTLVCEIMKLSPKYKEVILLYYYQEMKTTEISEALGIPASTVSVRLKRAREILKKRLEGWYYV